MMATQLMQVKLVNARGETMLLPEGLSVQGYSAQLEVPGVEIEGKHGMIVDRRLARVKPGSITISGSVYGLSKDDADRLRDSVVGFAANANPVQIYRYDDAQTYAVGDLVAVDHAYKTGYFDGRLFTLALRFVVSDPFLYSATFACMSFPPPVSTITVNNGGGVDVAPVIQITGPATAFELSNRMTGQLIEFRGEVNTSELLIIDCERFEAYTVTGGTPLGFLQPAQASYDFSRTSTIGEMGSSWLFGGFSLMPGPNVIVVSTGAEMGMQFSFRERWL